MAGLWLGLGLGLCRSKQTAVRYVSTKPTNFFR